MSALKSLRFNGKHCYCLSSPDLALLSFLGDRFDIFLYARSSCVCYGSSFFFFLDPVTKIGHSKMCSVLKKKVKKVVVKEIVHPDIKKEAK